MAAFPISDVLNYDYHSINNSYPCI